MAMAHFLGIQCVTVTKHIHGWLATKKRTYREGVYPTPQCEFCNTVEDSQHIFRCQNELMKDG